MVKLAVVTQTITFAETQNVRTTRVFVPWSAVVVGCVVIPTLWSWWNAPPKKPLASVSTLTPAPAVDPEDVVIKKADDDGL